MAPPGTTSPDGPILPLVIRDAYTLGLEKTPDGALWAHVWVHQPWSRAIKAALLRDGQALYDLGGTPWNALALNPHGGDHSKHRRFVTMMGFELYRTITGPDGVERGHYVKWK